MGLFGLFRGLGRQNRGLTGTKLGAAGAGMALLRSAGRSRSTFGRLAKLAAGGALLYRAVAGRGSLRRFMR